MPCFAFDPGAYLVELSKPSVGGEKGQGSRNPDATVVSTGDGLVRVVEAGDGRREIRIGDLMVTTAQQPAAPAQESASEFDALTNPLGMVRVDAELVRRFQGSAHVASRCAGRHLEPLLNVVNSLEAHGIDPVDVLDDLLQEAERRETDRVLAADL